MLIWTVVFLVIALLTGLFGFSGIGVGGAHIAKIFFFIFIFLFIWSLFFGRRSI